MLQQQFGEVGVVAEDCVVQGGVAIALLQIAVCTAGEQEG